ncbi:MAG: hypothetical protein AAF909_08560 [Pseudomonadota bacterium]
MSNAQSALLKSAAVLWIVWGLVHAFAGVMTIAAEPSDGFAAIADAVDPGALAADFHPAIGGVLNQHGWNLLWGGVVTTLGAVFIWRGDLTAIWVTAMIGGLLDLGYLMFVDLPGYVNFFPGTVMTIISATAILLSVPVGIALIRSKKAVRDRA